MCHLVRTAGWLAVLVLSLTLLMPGTASAHERRTVAGDYQLVVGFLNEPAFEGGVNGVSLAVTRGDAPVEGLEKTLKVEVGSGGQTTTYDLRPRFRTPGAYNAEFVPTRVGGYRFRFVGTLDGRPLDELFESGPGRFNDVEAIAPLQFPEKVPSGAELQRALAAAESRAATATTLAIAGLVAGLAGLALGAWALLRRRAPAEAAVVAQPAARSRPTAAASQERL